MSEDPQWDQPEPHRHHEEPQALLEVMSSPFPSRIDVHVHLDQGTGGGSAELLALLHDIIAKLTTQQGAIDHMSDALVDLTAAVTENTSVDQSAITLLNDLAAKLDAAATDPAAVAALAADIRASSADLAAAVVANTPAAPGAAAPPADVPPADLPPASTATGNV